MILLFRFVCTSWNLPCQHFYPRSFSTRVWQANSRSSVCGSSGTKNIQILLPHCKRNWKEKTNQQKNKDKNISSLREHRVMNKEKHHPLSSPYWREFSCRINISHSIRQGGRMRLWEEAEEKRKDTAVGMRNKADKIPINFKHGNSKAGSGITQRCSNLSPYN